MDTLSRRSSPVRAVCAALVVTVAGTLLVVQLALVPGGLRTTTSPSAFDGGSTPQEVTDALQMLEQEIDSLAADVEALPVEPPAMVPQDAPTPSRRAPARHLRTKRPTSKRDTSSGDDAVSESPPPCQMVPHCPKDEVCRSFLVVGGDSSGDFRVGAAGHTIWLVNVANMLCGSSQNETVVVHVLSPRHFTKEVLDTAPVLQMFRKDVTILDPFGGHLCIPDTSPPRRLWLKATQDIFILKRHDHVLKGAVLLTLLEKLTQAFNYDAMILRDNCQADYGAYVLRNSPALRGRLVIFGLDRVKDLEWEDIVPRYGAYQAVLSPIHFPDGIYSPERDGRDRHILWLPPMISEISSAVRDAPMGQTICYIGSYPTWSGDYMIEEMARGFRMMRRRSFPNATFLAVFTMYERATPAQQRLLQETEGFHILPPVSHEEAFRMYRHQCDLGVRGLRGDNRNVMSTKVLEMAAQGLPILINPQKIHDILFGEDYPLYWRYEDPVESFAEVATKALEDPALYHAVSERVVEMANRFSYDSIFEDVMAVLPRR